MDQFYTVKASIKLIKTEDGGLKTGVLSGYRPDHVFAYQASGDTMAAYIGDICFDREDAILPGQEKVATVRFLRDQPIQKYLQPGRQWWIHEGPKCVGVAGIIEVQS